MVEHLLIGDLAAILLVLGLTGPVLQPILAIKPLDKLRALAHPAVALPLWAIDLYV
jgi:cytochrome c oxidase assembly factor CtaG